MTESRSIAKLLFTDWNQWTDAEILKIGNLLSTIGVVMTTAGLITGMFRMRYDGIKKQRGL